MPVAASSHAVVERAHGGLVALRPVLTDDPRKPFDLVGYFQAHGSGVLGRKRGAQPVITEEFVDVRLPLWPHMSVPPNPRQLQKFSRETSGQGLCRLHGKLAVRDERRESF